MLLYYITDRRQLPAFGQRPRLLQKIAEAARCGVDFIQLREKDLTTRELEQLARDAVHILREARTATLETGKRKPETRLLINSRLDVALAAAADGVHLRSDDISAADARALWCKARSHICQTQADVGRQSGNWKPEAGNCTIAVSCHSAAEVRLAESQGADFAVFAPVFEKSGSPGVGLQQLRAACAGAAPAPGPEASPARGFPVLALGGVDLANAAECLLAGAAGVAGIRIFQENEMARVVAHLRAIGPVEVGR